MYQLKKKGKRRRREREPRNAAKILTLIKAVNDHKGFKQMASYNLSCLCKLVSPPLPDWNENLKFALKHGGLKACTAAVRANSGDESLLLAATSVMDQAATSEEGAAAVVSSGSLDACLDSIQANAGNMDSGALSATLTMSKIASKSSKNFVNKGTTDKIFQVMAMFKTKNSGVLNNCMSTLEKISKDQDGMNEIVQSGGIATLISTLDMGDLEEEMANDTSGVKVKRDLSFLKPAFALMRRFAGDNEQNIEYVRQCGAVNAVISAMDFVDADDAKLAHSGGALLSSLVTGEDLTDALACMNDDNISDKKVVQMTALISNLALDSDNAMDIVENGGVETIMKGLSRSGETAKSASKALERLAESSVNASIIVNSGAVEQLTELARNSKNDGAVNAAAMSALANLTDVDSAIERIVDSGGIELACDAILANSSSSKLATMNGLNILENIIDNGSTKTSVLVDKGANDAIISALQVSNSALKGEEVHAKGLEVCEKLIHGDDKAINSLVQLGLVPLILNNMENSNSKQTVQKSMELLDTFTDNPESLKALQNEDDSVSKVVSALNKHFDDEICREAASRTLKALVKPTHVNNAIVDIKQVLPHYTNDCDDRVGNRLLNALSILSALASNETLFKTYAKNEVHLVLKSVLKTTGGLDDAPFLENIIAASARVLHGIVEADNQKIAMLKSGVVKSLVQNMKVHPSFDTSISVGLKFIAMLSTDEDSIDTMVKEGGVEACVSSLRAHGDNAYIVGEATKTLLAISGKKEGVEATIKKGAGRYLLQVIEKHSDDRAFSNAVFSSAKALNKIAGDEEGRNLLRRQNSEEIVCNSLGMGGNDRALESEYSKLLGHVMSKKDIELSATDVVKGSQQSFEDINEEDLSTLVKTMETLTSALTNADNAETASKIPLAHALVTVISKAGQVQDPVMKKDLLDSSMKSLGKYASHQEVDPSLNSAAWVCNVLRTEPDSAITSIECIRDASAVSTTMSEALVEQTAIELVVWKMKQHPENDHVQQIGMQALGNMIKKVGYETIKDRVQSAGVEELVKNVVKETLLGTDESDASSAISGLKMISSMDAAALAENDMINVTVQVLTQHCFDEHTALDNGEVEDRQKVVERNQAMIEGISILSTAVAGGEEAAKGIVAKGTVNKVLTYALKEEGVMTNERATMDCLNLLENVSQTEGLDKGKASKYIIEAMQLNSTNEVLVEKASAILGKYVTKSDLAGQLESSQISLDSMNTAGQSNRKKFATAAKAVAAIATMSAAANTLDSETSESAHQLLESTSAVLVAPGGKGKEYNLALTSSMNLMTRLATTNVDVTQSENQQLLLQKALNDTSKDSSSKTAALGVLGSMSQLGAKGVEAAAKVGGIDAILSAVSNEDSSATTAQIAKSSLDQLTKSATDNLSSIDSKSMVQLVEANAIVTDNEEKSRRKTPTKNALQVCVENLSNTNDGQAILNDVLQTTNSDTAKVAVIESLGKRVGEGNEVKVSSKNREEVKKVLEGVRAHVNTNNNNDAGDSGVAAANVLGALELGDEGTGIFAEEGGLDILDLMIGSDDQASAQKAVAALSKIVAQDKLASERKGVKDKRVNNRLKDLKIASQIAAALSNQSDDDGNTDFANECIALLQELTSEAEPEEIGLDAEAILKIKKATQHRKSSINMGSAFIKSLAHMSQVAAALAAEGHVNEEILLAQWEVVLEDLQMQDIKIKELKTEDGKVYYLNQKTGATSWEKPLMQLNKTSLLRLSSLLTGIGRNNVPIVHNLGLLLKAVEMQSDNLSDLQIILEALRKFSVNKLNLDKISNNNGIIIISRTLHKLISKTIEDQQVLEQRRKCEIECAIMSARFAAIESYKVKVAESNIIQLLMHAHSNNMDEVFTKEAVASYGNFAYDYVPAIELMTKQGIIKLIEKVLQQFPDSKRIMELTLVTVSNLMYGNDDIKKDIGLTCGDEIVDVIKRHNEHKPIQQAAMRAVGNLASIDENIKWLLENECAATVVKCIEFHRSDPNVVGIAIDVLANLASVEDENHELTLHKMMLQQGTSECVMSVLNSSKDIQLIESCWDVISALTMEEDLCHEYLVPAGIVECMSNTIRKYDWHIGIMEHIAHLIHAMCYFPEILVSIAEEEIVPNLLAAMLQHADNDEFLLNAQSSITIFLQHEEEQEILIEENGLDTLYSLMQSHGSNKVFLIELLNTLIRLACNDKYVEKVALTGMSEIINCNEKFADDPHILSKIMTLLGQFALHDAVLNDIVQFGGIDFVIDAVSQHPEDEQLVLQAIHSLDNIGTGSSEHAHILTEKGGIEVLKHCADAYRGSDGNDEIVQNAESAILTIESQRELGDKPKASNTSSKNMISHLESHDNLDHFAEFRESFLSGTFKVVDWSSGKSKYTIKCSETWDSLQFCNKKGKVKKTIFLDNLRSITVGRRSGGHSSITGKAKADRAFYLEHTGNASKKKKSNSASFADLESPSSSDCNQVVRGLRLLHRLYKVNPNQLKNPDGGK